MLFNRRQKILKTLVSDRVVNDIITKRKRIGLYGFTHHKDGTTNGGSVFIIITLYLVVIAISAAIIGFIILFLKLAQVL